jgi:predicted cupin superfamily sugar epimerase
MAMAARAAELVSRLGLAAHPEGGHYTEVFRSTATVDAGGGRPRRAALTSIYFLLCAGEVSRWHRVGSDEVWCHVEGAAIELHQVDSATRQVQSALLARVSAQAAPQCTVLAGAWQAARSQGAYSLAACTVAPGFDFADFELLAAQDPLRAWLQREHPRLAAF